MVVLVLAVLLDDLGNAYVIFGENLCHFSKYTAAVFVHGDAVEDAMFFGRGAGELPTASAVVGDIFDIVRNMEAGCCGRIGCTCYKQLPVKRMEIHSYTDCLLP